MTKRGTFKVGDNVTAPDLAFTGKVTATHTSYLVRRGETDIVVGEEELQPTDKVLQDSVSYCVERNWDGVQVWLEPSQLLAGHLNTYADIRSAR